MQDLPFDATYDPASSVLRVSGSIDPDLADDLAAALASARSDADRRVTIDLSNVTYLPSIGVAVLVQGMRRAVQDAVDLVLVAAKGTVAERVLHLTGIPHQHVRVTDGLRPGSSV